MMISHNLSLNLLTRSRHVECETTPIVVTLTCLVSVHVIHAFSSVHAVVDMLRVLLWCC